MAKALHRRVVPENYVQLLYEYLENKGHDPEALLEAPWPKPDPSGIGGVDVELWANLLERASKKLRKPHLPIEMAQTITPRHLGILGAVLLASENAAAALMRFEQYQRLIFDVNPMELRYSPDRFEIVWDVREYTVRPLVEQAGFAVTLHFARSIMRGTINCLEVRFSGDGPSNTKPFETFFGCKPVFNSPEPGFVLHPSILELPLRTSDPSIISLLEQHANRLIDQLPWQDEIVDKVRKEIARSLRDGEPDIDIISNRLHTSSRTLQRKLLAAATTFRKELNTVRHELATSYLKDPRLKIVDVALLLGYSEHSAFTRAYKEWTGKAPQEARGAT